MNNFSIIIPTLWRCPEIFESIQQLSNNRYVKEIIIINNDISRQPDRDKIQISDKVIIVTPLNNIYVAAAWNMGARMASQDIICFLNDDVILNDRIFELFQQTDFSSIGLVGLQENAVSPDPNPDYPVELIPVDGRGHGYGCCMFVHKNHYVPIPADIKVFFTDDWLIVAIRKYHKKPHHLLKCSIKGRMSVTSTEFNHIYHRDGEIFHHLMRDFD